MKPVTAFDTDVIIYAAIENHPQGVRVAALFRDTPKGQSVGLGSVLLLPEVLTKPLRAAATSTEAGDLNELLSRLDLHPVDEPTARLALVVAVEYGLRAADAAHLATAITAGADRFLTNNRRDFPRSISEIDVIYPGDLPEA
ncbi:type II toxin-antitoxin system VapC family toxin [Acidipropionibacterium virtanenii]|uniref:tRNA(fMet)-specific endonuclease VapC n=1 Tax=Acidipropionibacterium virtanenii TaxID=2057246 RepID=A0A344UPV6_9ACTN|nr:PIN domain-containing protein [Acidipropionibacterium virtanenii]AXE37304.1 tRNA(fMet)-specific endonuclease VapC [Acidipropionibacterium virtanenii]